MKLSKYSKYLFEIAAITIGITLSFMVDEWREEKQNRKETLKALNEIKKDLVADTVEYRQEIKYLNEIAEGLKFVYITEFEEISFDSCKYIIDKAAPYLTSYFPIKGSYEKFKATISNSIIYNDSLTNLLSNYYNMEKITQINNRSEHSMIKSWEYSSFIGHWLIDDFNLNTTQKKLYTEACKGLFKDITFKNDILNRLLVSNTQSSIYMQKVLLSQKLIHQIEEEINH